MSVYIDRFRDLSRRAQAGLSALVLTFAAVAPVLITGTVSAAPALTSRQLTSTSARPSQTTQLAWNFNTTADAGNVNSIEIEFCDSPLGTCNTTKVPTIAATPAATLANFTTNGVTSTTRGNGDSGGTNNQIVIVKSTVDTGTSLSAASITLVATDITNNATANASYYTRVRLYSDTGTTLKWEGVFAQSTSQTLTVNARVQERLDFCVGSTTSNDATTSVGAACANITGTAVNIGNVEGGNVNVSPVATVNGGDATPTNGVAMIRTNAVNGAVVDYKSLLDTSSGALKVPGATCTAAVVSNIGTDQCFNTDTVQAAVVAGTEKFGMTIAGINCGSTTAYTCVFSTGAYNLARNASYDGNGADTYVTDSDQVAGTTNGGYAWQATGAATTIASSTASTVKVIDDEALILKFAATAGVTTPTGSYTVQADFIATATF